ncbi:MAG: CotH kinase family protein [Oscillospiraceae bacterium]|nr:CotH kinase family protein [Oscillospiraceae bacterium]
MLYTKSDAFLAKLKVILAAALLIAFFGFALLLSDMLANEKTRPATKPFDGKFPENAALTVSDIRVKGFTVHWTEIEGEVEYAIAASSRDNIADYQAALENDCVILDFVPGKELKGTYRATKMIPGKDYTIKLFVRSKNTLPAEYLSANAELPYIDDAELLEVYIDGKRAFYDKYEDRFFMTYLPSGEKETKQYIINYKTGRLSELYKDGGETKIPDEFILAEGESVFVTAVNEKTGAMRDYEISVKPLDNGLPLIVINVDDNRPVTSKTKYLNAEMQIFDSEKNPSDEYTDGLFSGGIEIKARGNSSFGSPKKGYNINLGEKRVVLDMASSRNWMMMGNYSDKTLMRNFVAYELYRSMGAAFSPKFRFAELVFNGEYMGVYCFGERIKIDKGRLELPKIKVEERIKDKNTGTLVIPPTSGEDLNGSYILELNSTDKYSREEIIFETQRINWTTGHFFSIKQPGKDNMSPEAYEYISNYVNETENAIFAENFKDLENGYRKYIDTATFIDWYLVNELFKNADSGFHTSVYFYKPRGGKLCMGPVWDFDIGAGNIDYANCDDPAGWHVRYASWFYRLFEDEEFAKEFKERWNYVKRNDLPKMFELIDETAALLAQAQTANFAKWPILGSYVWPNAAGFEHRGTYESEVEYLKDWLQARIAWMDGEINK